MSALRCTLAVAKRGSVALPSAHLLLATLLCSLSNAAVADAVLTGRVVDENNTPVPEVRVTLSAGNDAGSSGVKAAATSDVSGLFSFRVPPGSYRLAAERANFFSVLEQVIRLGEAPQEIEIRLAHVRQTSESINVSATSSPVDVEGTSSVRRLTGKQILDVPYPSTRSMRNALRLIPGVVQDANGGLHFDGGMESQVLYTLNGFNLGDPTTGRLSARLPIESVRSLEYSSGRYSAEFGKGSAGALAIETANGDDQLRYSATNFVPGIETQRGLRLNSWTPRFQLSGPVRKGRAWFSETVEAGYNQIVIPDLPKGQDTAIRLRGGNVLHGQVNLTPANIVTLDFLANYETAPKSGLSPLDPASTSVDRNNRQWFFAVKDQIYLGHGMLFEAGYASNRTLSRDRPQGEGFYILTPNGRTGNWFVNSTQRSNRDQVLANLYFPAFSFWGSHQWKVGMDLDRLQFTQEARRTGYEHYGIAGQLLSRTTFAGNAHFSLPNTEVSTYIVDAWRMKPNLIVEYGVRQDWDRLVDRLLLSPRIAVAYSPFSSKRLKLSAGYAIVHDASSLALFARPLDQYAVTTDYNADGSTARPPVLTVFRTSGSRHRSPRYRNWSLGVERELPARFRLSFHFLRRSGADGFTYTPDRSASTLAAVTFFGGPAVPGTYVLRNDRKDIYDSASVTLNHSFGEEYAWMVNYTRSRALSNAVVDISVDQPLQIRDNFGPLSWDAPNRLLSWGFLPAWGRNWAIAYLCDLQSGFPFSVERETGSLVGAVNSHRFPMNFDLNLHIERRFHLGRYRFALRAGINNLTNHLNATSVNTVVESPNFLRYYGREGRHGVLRIRWLKKD